jgi:hypothetical protein
VSAIDTTKKRKNRMGTHNYETEQEWYDRLVEVAESHDNSFAVRDREGWIMDWEEMTPEESYYGEYPEHKK